MGALRRAGAIAAVSVAGAVLAGGCGVDRSVHRAALDRNSERLTRAQALEQERAALDRELEEGRRRFGARSEQATVTAAGLETRLAERRRRADARATRVANLRRFVQGVRSALGSEGVDVRVRHGRILVGVPEAVLFDSGEASLKPGAGTLLDRMASLIRGSGATFRITGHTDNVPIRTRKYPSNWELSSARAVKVVEALIARGVDPARLAASGSADNEPIADNASDEGRARNRRIELILEPDLSELPEVRTALTAPVEGRR